jgi:hypothetical protein
MQRRDAQLVELGRGRFAFGYSARAEKRPFELTTRTARSAARCSKPFTA